MIYIMIRKIIAAAHRIWAAVKPTKGPGLLQGRDITYAVMAMMLFTFAHADLRADVAELTPSLDTTLYEDGNGGLGNGSGQYLFIGRTGGDNGVDKLLRRSLVKFDLAGVPAGSTISSVSFSVTIDKVPPGASSAIVSLHPVTADWGEGASNAPGDEGRGTAAQVNDATWLHRFFDTRQWSTPGGDFDAQPLASQSISGSPQTVTFASSPQLVAAVQDWLDDPASNHGWMLIGDEASVKNARRILSRENSGPGNPLLSVEFTYPLPAANNIPAVNGVGLIALGLMLLLTGRAFVAGRSWPGTRSVLSRRANRK
jgi:hypothetical protein